MVETRTKFKGIEVVSHAIAVLNTWQLVFAANPERQAWFIENTLGGADNLVVGIGTTLTPSPDVVPITTIAPGRSVGDKFSNLIAQGIYIKSATASVPYTAFEKNV